ncbi:hypothetical protein DYB32_004092 [Aphanomyces invadans]|uniref:Uncharacterized protein n=1 Tax=Aphanomyces invadans TaxID=157072 RepID=A0A3R6VC60_9STRA|nr:hypothetical protein DYB32_004092 [Aphanomyces invadans]
MTTTTHLTHASTNNPSILTEEDMWTIDTILGTEDLLTLDDDIQKDLDFLSASPAIAPSIVPLTILTTPDALMNHAFATEECFSPQPRQRPRYFVAGSMKTFSQISL